MKTVVYGPCVDLHFIYGESDKKLNIKLDVDTLYFNLLLTN